jgi:hypothetical protein
MRRWFATILVIFAFGQGPVWTARAQTNTYVVPHELENSYGDAGGDIGLSGAPTQLIYAASEFSGLSVGQIVIKGVAFRLDESAAGSSLDAVIPSLSLIMGVYRGDLSSVNGFVPLANQALVYGARDLHLTAQPGLGFNATFRFQTPYTYDPQNGNLVIFVGSAAGGLGQLKSFDGQIAPGRGVLVEETGPVFPANVAPVLFATQFSYSSVPEPGIEALLFVGGLLLCWRRK